MSAISIETKRIDELDSFKNVQGNGQFLYLEQNGKTTKKITTDDILDYVGSVSPNSIFRGKNLGSKVTSDQLNDISTGAFRLVHLGDYWNMGGLNWRIWGFDWYFNKGDTALTKHHVVILPDECLLKPDGSTTHYMNDKDDTTGAYKGSKLRTTYIPQMTTTITGLFGADHVLKHRELITNTVSDGKASNREWMDSQVEIPTEVMMYGSTVFGSGYDVGTNHPILPLARIKPQYARCSNAFWLRDVASASWFAYVNVNGAANNLGASYAGAGVRPYFLLG